MTALEEILMDVRQRAIDTEDARDKIRALFASILEESAADIGSVESTSMYVKIAGMIENA